MDFERFSEQNFHKTLNIFVSAEISLITRYTYKSKHLRSLLDSMKGPPLQRKKIWTQCGMYLTIYLNAARTISQNDCNRVRIIVCGVDIRMHFYKGKRKFSVGFMSRKFEES